jgi:protein transport protein SEC61 subunit alpha
MKVLIKNQRVRKQQSNYPIKLFYTSSLPLILQAALLYNFYLFSLLIFTQFSSNFFVNLIGIWKVYLTFLRKSITPYLCS